MEPVTMMSPWQAVKDYYARSIVINGRTPRSGYWWVYLYHLMIGIPMLVLQSSSPETGNMLVWPWVAVHAIPTFTLMVRRFHDGGSSAWYALLAFVPLIGGLILLVFLLKSTEVGSNDWGASWDVLENARRSSERQRDIAT